MRMTGLVAIHMASIRNSPRSRAASKRSWVVAASSVIGFSQSTCLPASSASIVCSACNECGEATYTTSTAGSATSSS